MKKLPFFAILSTLAMVGVSSLSSIAIAQESAKSARQSSNAIKFRQSVFQLIRSNIGPLGAMAKGQIPYNADVMAKNAERMMQLAAMVPDYMLLDTSKFPIENSASEEVWSNLDDFNKKAQDLYLAAEALKGIAESKNESQYKAAIGKVSRTCKGCHDSYKTD